MRSKTIGMFATCTSHDTSKVVLTSLTTRKKEESSLLEEKKMIIWTCKDIGETCLEGFDVVEYVTAFFNTLPVVQF